MGATIAKFWPLWAELDRVVGVQDIAPGRFRHCL